MTERDGQHAVSEELATQAAKRVRSVLIPVDLTPISDRVLTRVALLPLSAGARLTPLHVVPSTLSPRDRRAAQRAAKKLLADESRNLATVLPRGVRIAPVVKIGAAAEGIASCARATRADLVVMGRGGGSAVRDMFLGSTAERVVRRTKLPVLVVRLPARAPYTRPAIALDFDRAAGEALAMLQRLLPAPPPRVLVIHAFDVLYKGRVYMNLSEEEAEESRAQYRQRAARRLVNLLAAQRPAAGARPGGMPLWRTHLEFGAPRLVIKKAVRKAGSDLLVLGTRGISGAMHVFLGTVAGDVLREVACDVLVVPPRPRRK